IKQLQWMMHVLNQPIERSLAEIIHDPKKTLNQQLDGGLMALLTLYNKLRSTNADAKVLEGIERFLDTLRLVSLLNLQVDPAKPKTQWFRIDLPFIFENPPPQAKNSHFVEKASIRIAYLPDEIPLRIDAKHTRFLVQVDLEKGIIEVDVSLAQEKVGIHVRSNDPFLLEQAKEEIITLNEGINQLGYLIQSTHYELADLVPLNKMGEYSAKNWSEVRLGV
ncbi:MAG: hypothetical protein ACPL7A_01725, partial [Anaerolineales bacterium]